ncbi:ArsR/SmtB family transcription factor [Virgibacillus senegalensis]|uniref:ArsR/SmtB family transcription factor n=1 Tax=Virgibacillus senegalensis TaxID=1499679 RepID=UPI00069E8B40|nr:metalloregulator ArsR/SmtB family transcription factor [Virgibacillus senegalensis]
MAAENYDVFQAIADPTRRQVLQMLAGRNLPISKITSHFQISRTAVVKHLRILSEAGLVTSEKIGREKRYHLKPEPLFEVKDWLGFYEQFWDNKLTRLKYVVETEEETD